MIPSLDNSSNTKSDDGDLELFRLLPEAIASFSVERFPLTFSKAWHAAPRLGVSEDLCSLEKKLTAVPRQVECSNLPSRRLPRDYASRGLEQIVELFATKIFSLSVPKTVDIADKHQLQTVSNAKVDYRFFDQISNFLRCDGRMACCHTVLGHCRQRDDPHGENRCPERTTNC